MRPRLLNSSAVRKAAVSFVLATVAWVYTPRLMDTFLSDDFCCVRVFEFEDSGDGFSAEWWDVTVGSLDFNFRPVVGASGWILHRIGGLNPFWWHLANLILHLGCILLVMALSCRVVASDWAGIGAGMLFGLHFIHAEPVVWISGRPSLLAAFFVLAAAVLESRPRARTWGWRRYAGIVSACLALLSKENAVALSVLLLLVPPEPYRLTDAAVHSARVRRWPGLLAERLRRQWPYWVLTLVFIVTRFQAIVTGVHGTAYRIEAGLSVVKNLVFVCVSSLFPLDFRTGLGAWNQWYVDRDWLTLAGWINGQPVMIIGVIVAVLFWALALLAGHPAVRRMAGWMIVAALPTLFFRGSGERLMYLGIAGSSVAIAAMLTCWHQAFVMGFRRAGRYLAPALLAVFLAFNVSWLKAKLIDWESASLLTGTIIEQLCDAGAALPRNARVHFENLPDNINGAWVFRSGIKDAFMLYCGRPDVTPVPRVAAESDSLTVVLRWDGAVFQKQSCGAAL